MRPVLALWTGLFAVALALPSGRAAGDHIVFLIDNPEYNADGLHLAGVNYPWVVEG